MFKAFYTWSAGAKISVTTDKPYYVSGELVTGNISLWSDVPVEAQAIIVQVKGYTKVEWLKRATEPQDQSIPPAERPPAVHFLERNQNKKVFFQQDIEAYTINGVLAPGTHNFPFQYRLPDGLHGSFYEYEANTEHKLEIRDKDNNDVNNFYDPDDAGYGRNAYSAAKLLAQTTYTIRATLRKQGFFSMDLQAVAPLIIHPKLGKDVKPANGEKEGKVLFCCCIPRGSVRMKAQFDKNAYAPNETAIIDVDIENDSAKDVKMVVKLNRFLTLVGRKGRTNRNTVPAQKDYGVVKAGETKKIHMELPLVGNGITPSTAGDMIKCEYRYDIEAQISMCPDVEVQLPVTIYAPQPPPEYALPTF